MCWHILRSINFHSSKLPYLEVAYLTFFLNPYTLLFENNAIEIIPVPFTKAETIEIDLSKLPVKAGNTLRSLALDKSVLSQTKIASGKLTIKVDGKAFSYKITK